MACCRHNELSMDRGRQCFLGHPKTEPALVILPSTSARKSREAFVFGMGGDVEQCAAAIDRIYFDFVRLCAELRACKTCSVAEMPVCHPPCAVEKSAPEQASPAKKSRPSTGAASTARQSAIPGIAYEYEPRANGSARQRWTRIG